MNKLFVLKKEELSIFTESYNHYCISKHFSTVVDKNDSVSTIKVSANIKTNKEYQLKNLGRMFAVKENLLIIKKILDMNKCYNLKNVSLENLNEIIVSLDPHSIRILIMSHFVQKELILKKMVTFNPETKCYQCLGREVVLSHDLNNKIIFICKELLYVVTNGLNFNEVRDEITVTKKLALSYSHGYSEENNFEVFLI